LSSHPQSRSFSPSNSWQTQPSPSRWGLWRTSALLFRKCGATTGPLPDPKAQSMDRIREIRGAWREPSSSRRVRGLVAAPWMVTVTSPALPWRQGAALALMATSSQPSSGATGPRARGRAHGWSASRGREAAPRANVRVLRPRTCEDMGAGPDAELDKAQDPKGPAVRVITYRNSF
jgi:hypothetical protein